MPEYLWYAAYGSNLHARRLTYYIEGGTPPGTGHTYPGFRDPTPPLKTQPLTLPGTIYFAWDSPVWTGGVAFYATNPQPHWPQGAAARGYLLTPGQFSDLLAQEMYREPHGDLDFAEVLDAGHSQLGPGRYETLVQATELDGWPVLTFTSPWDPATVELQRPSARYLQMITSGLHESHQWSGGNVFGYLSKLPGVQENWDKKELHQLIDEALENPATA